MRIHLREFLSPREKVSRNGYILLRTMRPLPRNAVHYNDGLCNIVPAR